jgi:hypothetical protein
MVVKRALRNQQAPEPRHEASILPCPLCARPMVVGVSTDEHHLVPVSKGGRHKELVHKVCHRMIHATFTETELARHFNTWEALRLHPEIETFVRWIASKPPTFLPRTFKSARKR